MDRVISADNAALLVLKKAREALEQGTFAVGGLLFRNDTKEILVQMHNNVFVPLSNRSQFMKDPTSHGERQLISWYFENRLVLSLPEPKDITLVTSLDPCLMCTGALLESGFNVAIISIDDYAGINYDSKFDFKTLPASLRAMAKKKFGYYSCGKLEHESKEIVRTYHGPKSIPFSKDIVSSNHEMECREIFAKSVKNIDSIFAKISEINLENMTDPHYLPEDSEIKKSFRRIYPKAFTKKINPELSNSEIIDELKSVASSPTGDGNAVAFIDPFGNLVLCQSGNEVISPISTPMMEVIQKYSKTLWDLMNHDKTRVIVEKTLAHPRFGTFLFLYAPEPDKAKTIMELGAYCFTMYQNTSQKFSNLRFVNPPREGKIEDLISLISNFPPFYTEQVNLSIYQIPK